MVIGSPRVGWSDVSNLVAEVRQQLTQHLTSLGHSAGGAWQVDDDRAAAAACHAAAERRQRSLCPTVRAQCFHHPWQLLVQQGAGVLGSQVIGRDTGASWCEDHLWGAVGKYARKFDAHGLTVWNDQRLSTVIPQVVGQF